MKQDVIKQLDMTLFSVGVVGIIQDSFSPTFNSNNSLRLYPCPIRCACLLCCRVPFCSASRGQGLWERPKLRSRGSWMLEPTRRVRPSLPWRHRAAETRGLEVSKAQRGVARSGGFLSLKLHVSFSRTLRVRYIESLPS